MSFYPQSLLRQLDESDDGIVALVVPGCIGPTRRQIRARLVSEAIAHALRHRPALRLEVRYGIPPYQDEPDQVFIVIDPRGGTS